MRNIYMLALMGVVALGVAACSVVSHCETEPMVEENHKLIVPPNFGQMPK